MKRNLSLVFALIPLVATIAACDQSPPKCSDESTFSLVKEIIAEQVQTGNELSKKNAQDNLVIEYARPSAYDKSIKKLTCEARIVSGGSYQLPITYESQLDDNNQHIVSVSGIQPEDLIHLRVAIGKILTKTESSPEGKASQQIIPAVTQAQVPATSSESDLEACTMKKIAAYRAEVGPDEDGEERPVRFDMVEEWEGECREGK